MEKQIIKIEYLLPVKDELICVKKEIYKEFYRMKNREDYLEKLDRKNGLIRFSDYDRDGSRETFMDSIPDKSADVEKILEKKIEIRSLYFALNKLSQEERRLIYDIYFKEISLRQLALKKNVSLSTIQYYRDKILDKLRNILESS